MLIHIFFFDTDSSILYQKKNMNHNKYKLIISDNLPSYPNECYRLSGWNGWKFKKSSKLLV
jgi:hypothetical protein